MQSILTTSRSSLSSSWPSSMAMNCSSLLIDILVRKSGEVGKMLSRMNLKIVPKSERGWTVETTGDKTKSEQKGKK